MSSKPRENAMGVERERKYDWEGRADKWNSFISYRTGQYKLHYYETPTSIKFVMLTDTQMLNMRNVLHQIYVNLYVEFGTLPLLAGFFWCHG
jgi:Sybindin-like family